METEVDKTRDWLRDNAEKAAQAKAYRIYCEKYRKSLKAIIFNEQEGTMAERENKAYSDPRYLKHLEELKDAVFQDEHMKALRAAAEMKIEIWRTEQANYRAMKV